MFYFLVKHKRLLGILTLLAGISLAFWGVGFGTPDAELQGFGMPVAQVGPEKITAQEFYQRYTQIRQSMSQQDVPPTAEELIANGTVERILDQLIENVLIERAAQEHRVYPTDEYLMEQLKEDPFFQNDAGEFDSRFYNQWVQSMTRRGQNWNDIYELVARQVNRQAFSDLIRARARVTEPELRQAYEDSHTKLRVKYAAIEPTVEVTDEELRQHYEENRIRYMHPEERTAEFVAIEIPMPKPPIVDELIERARGGEDFAELAREYSEGPLAEEGGDLGWLEQTEDTPAHRLPLFELEPGAVSDPVQGDLGFHIYTVEETRESEEGGQEVHARQILIRPVLEPEVREEKLTLAQEIALAAKESGDLAAAAEEHDLTVQTTNPFSFQTAEIDGVPGVDAFTFRSRLSRLDVDDVSDPVEAQRHIYVAKIVEKTDPRQMTFEEAREDIERDAISLHKNSPDYLNRVRDYISRIQTETSSLEEIAEQFPELEVEIQEVEEPFTANEQLFGQGIFWPARQAFDALEGKEPGEIGGPILDFQRVYHFVELVERQPPTEQDWEEDYPAEREVLRESLVTTKANRLESDYIQYLYDQAAAEALIQKDYDAVLALLGVGQETEDEELGLPEPAPDEDLVIEQVEVDESGEPVAAPNAPETEISTEETAATGETE